MTAEIINLRKFRKARERAEKERLAAENRVRHGRSKAEREASEGIEAIERRRHDGAALEDAAGGPDDDNGPGKAS